LKLVLLSLALLLQEQTVPQLLERLGSEKIEEREDAARRLLGLGKTALPELEKAAREGGPDISRRAKAIVKLINPATSLEAFENIEEALLKARSLRIAFKGETLMQSDEGDPERKTTFSGVLLLKEGDKALYSSVREVPGGKRLDTFLVSDGSKMSGSREGGQNSETPSGLKRALTLALSRMGPCSAAGAVAAALGHLNPLDPGETMESALVVGDFGPLETDGDAKVIEFRFKGVKFGTSGKVRLWYDPKTYAVRKRTLFVASRKTTITDVFDEYVLNPDLPDDRFKLPQERK
jgi:outer membrane lipoprotein-sorting protein